MSPGRSGGCPPPLPQIRTCPIKAYGSSSHGFATPAQGRHRYSLESRAHDFRARGLFHVSLQRFPDPTPPSLHEVPIGCVPPLRRCYSAFRPPADRPAALLCPSVGSTIPVRLLSSLPADPTPTCGPGAFGSGCPTPVVSRWSRRVSQVPGQPSCTYARVSDPGGTD